MVSLQDVFLYMLAMCMRMARRPRQLRLMAPEDNVLNTALDNDSSIGEIARRRYPRFSMPWVQDWRWVWTELGTAGMVVCTSESAMQLVRHSFSRAVHLNLAMGFSKGFALLIITVIVLVQVASSLTLLVPTIYHKTGSIAPSAALAATLWFEAAVFGDAMDHVFALRCAALTATATMTALFRFDRQARNSMAQLPTSGTLLNIESYVRKACTAGRTGLIFPPLAITTVAWVVYFNPFWRSHGILYEWYRGRFQAGIAMASLLLLIGGQDTRAARWTAELTIRISDRVERILDLAMRRKDRLLGQDSPMRPLGRKKAL